MVDLNLPSLLPKVIDPTWFCVDKPVDDHEELCKLEEEHQAWVGVISLTHGFTIRTSMTLTGSYKMRKCESAKARKCESEHV